MPEGARVLKAGTTIKIGGETFSAATDFAIFYTGTESSLAGVLAQSGNLGLNSDGLKLKYDSDGRILPLRLQGLKQKDVPDFITNLDAMEAYGMEGVSRETYEGYRAVEDAKKQKKK